MTNPQLIPHIDLNKVLTEIQSVGIVMEHTQIGASERKGGAGPTDHKAMSINGSTIMVPLFNKSASSSPYSVGKPNELGVAQLFHKTKRIAAVTFPNQPKFYSHNTSDGIPMWKVAQLHSKNVLATTVLQNCIRYKDKSTSCQFCAIGESLKANKTIGFKKPHHLAEVAKLAVELDGIEQMIMTTGTPSTNDRGAKILYESVLAVKAVVDIPTQVQCEPPEDFSWFMKLRNAGADNIGMHLEAVSDRVRNKIMPGKAEVSLEHYFNAYKAAVSVFGRGNVSTYILAGLGDTQEEILSMSSMLVNIGVYPFVVPFVPIQGTPLQNHRSPEKDFMKELLEKVGEIIAVSDFDSESTKAGCAKCGACSTLKLFENKVITHDH